MQIKTFYRSKVRERISRESIFFTIPLLRCILALISGISLFAGRKNIAVYIFVLAALIGFFENFLARRYPSQLRAIIDFFADKLLVNAIAIILALQNIIPFWAMLIILARDMITIIGGAVLFYRDFRREFKPFLAGKLSYFFQIMALLQAMIFLEVEWLGMGTALFLTVISGAYAVIKSEFRFVKRRSDIEEFRMLKLIKFADLITLSSVALGIVVIILSIGNKFKLAAIIMLASAFIDYLDGKVARALHQQNNFGKQLDSLADIVSFGVAPAIFGFSLMQYTASINPLQLNFGIIAFTIFVFCGILRLARYNIMDMKGAYQGMPITLSGVIIPIMFFFNMPIRFYPFFYLLLGALMVSSIRVKKFI